MMRVRVTIESCSASTTIKSGWTMSVSVNSTSTGANSTRPLPVLPNIVLRRS